MTSVWCSASFVDRYAHSLKALPAIKSAVEAVRVALDNRGTRWHASREWVPFKGLSGVHRRHVGDDYRLFAYNPKDGRAILLEVALKSKRTYEKYTTRDLERDLASAVPAPPELLNSESSLPFGTVAGSLEAPFGVEDTPAWVDFLDDEQTEIALQIIQDLDDRGPRKAAWLLSGPPGSGKTVVLLHVLTHAMLRGWRVGLVMSARVADYLERSLSTGDFHWDLQSLRVSPPTWSDLMQNLLIDPNGGEPSAAHSEYDLLIVDDPASIPALSEIRHNAAEHNFGVVIACDPWQLNPVPVDSEWKSLTKALNHAHLQTLYRQRRELGEALSPSQRAVAAASKFAIEERAKADLANRKAMMKLLDGVSYRMPGGQLRTLDSLTKAALRDEVRRLQQLERGLWWWWPPLLVCVDERLGAVPKPISQLLEPVPHDLVHLDQQQSQTDIPGKHRARRPAGLEYVQGVEYQHTFLFVSKQLLQALTKPSRGDRQAVVDERRRLRIPLSRARDTCLIVPVNKWSDIK